MKHSAEDEIKNLIALYALRALETEELELIELHLPKCKECQEELYSLELLAGTLAYVASPQIPPTKAKEKIFAAIEKESQQEIKPKVSKKPQDPASFLTIRANEGEWLEISKGVFSKTLFSNIEAGTITNVIKMLPGAQAELHYHTSIEECYVIDGDFHVGDSQETEIELGPGDYHCAQAGSTHAVAYTNYGTQLLVVMPLNCEIACELPNK